MRLGPISAKLRSFYLSAFVDFSDSEPAAEPTDLRVKYKIGKQIGEGNFAVVKECTEKYVFVIISVFIAYSTKTLDLCSTNYRCTKWL